MAIASMTGYASERVELNNFALSIDLKTINSRYLELKFLYSNDLLRSFEPQLREIITNGIQRGKVECIVSLQQVTSHEQSLDMQALEPLFKQIDALKQRFPSAAINLVDILNLPQVLEQQQSLNHDELSSSVQQLALKAVAKLNANRETEGANLVQSILAKLDLIELNLKPIQENLRNLIQDETLKLQSKIKNLAVDVDESRLQQEIVLCAQKADIAEEYDRLCSHTKQCRDILKHNSTCGKKLDFLMQEFNREANTIASKTSSLEITRIAVELKVLIEQIREQVQNLQ